MTAAAVTAAAAMLVWASRDVWPVLVPLLAILIIALGFVTHLYYRDHQLPVFDLGALTVFATAVYSAVPLLGFWLSGLRWTTFSYLPLWLHHPGPVEVGAFASHHVVYLASFAAAYLIFRGRATIRCGPLRELRPTAVAAIALSILALLAYFELLRVVFGVSYDPSYSDLTIATAADALPHVVRQASHNLFAVLVLLKVAALTWLMPRWQDWRWRSALLVWLAVEGLLTVTRMGGRTWYATLLMAAVLMYHRAVKPLPAARAGILVAALLSGTLVYGMARDIAGGLRTVSEADHTPWATMNEFQALFGIAYDLHARQEAGTLGRVPWQLYASDVIRVVPSQFLPFAKADPCLGYPVVDGIGVGCVMSVISHAIIGLGRIELVIRGIALGLLFASIHRWYVRRQSSYWATLFYLCLCLWSYYTFRGSTLYFAYSVIYRFLPMIVLIVAMQFVVKTARRGLAAAGV